MQVEAWFTMLKAKGKDAVAFGRCRVLASIGTRHIRLDQAAAIHSTYHMIL